jgi:hypothetical protein
MGLSARDQKEKYARICDVKSRISFEELCWGLPAEFVRYFHAVRGLGFSEQPNYAELRLMFRELFMCEGYLDDYRYDWERPMPPVTSASPPARPSISVGDDSFDQEEMFRPIVLPPQKVRPDPQPQSSMAIIADDPFRPARELRAILQTDIDSPPRRAMAGDPRGQSSMTSARRPPVRCARTRTEDFGPATRRPKMAAPGRVHPTSTALMPNWIVEQTRTRTGRRPPEVNRFVRADQNRDK